jgi:hypothetical protein
MANSAYAAKSRFFEFNKIKTLIIDIKPDHFYVFLDILQRDRP